MIKELIALANHLDSKGLTKEADYLDSIIKKSKVSPMFEDMFSDTNDILDIDNSIEEESVPKPDKCKKLVDAALSLVAAGNGDIVEFARQAMMFFDIAKMFASNKMVLDIPSPTEIRMSSRKLFTLYSGATRSLNDPLFLLARTLDNAVFDMASDMYEGVNRIGSFLTFASKANISYECALKVAVAVAGEQDRDLIIHHLDALYNN